MRILLTADPELPVPPLLYGGIERIIASLIDEVRRRGHVVGLVAHAASSVPVEALFPWPGVGRHDRLATVKNIFALRAAVRSFEPSVVHSFSRLWYLMGMLGSKTPRIMSYQREPTGRTVSMANRLHGRFIQFTGCSRYIADRGRLGGGGEWSPIPNFVDLRKYTFRPVVPEDAPLVFLSRIEPIKGADLAIRIARKSGRRLIIAGNHDDHGVNGNYWREQIAPEIGKNGIEYIGPVNDTQKNELLGAAAAMLVPIQWNEPFGIVFAESLACGTPVISFATGALPEIVIHGVHGFLIDSLESGVLAVEGLSAIDRAICRQEAETHFSASVVADQYEQLYERLIVLCR